MTPAKISRKKRGRRMGVSVEKPLLVIVSGPSGVGKSTLVHALVARRKWLKFVPGVTTRKPERRGGGKKKEHVFMTNAAFNKLKAAGGFLESDRFLQFQYGTSRTAVERVFKAKKVPVLVLDVQGHKKIRRLEKFSVRSAFITAGNYFDLRKRLLKRHPDMNRVRLGRRLAEARVAERHAREYNIRLLNREGKFDLALARLVRWIDRQRHLR